MHSQHLQGSSSEQKHKPDFAEGYHILLTLYVCLQLRHTTGGVILHIMKKSRQGERGLEEETGEVASWPGESLSRTGQLPHTQPYSVRTKRNFLVASARAVCALS